MNLSIGIAVMAKLPRAGDPKTRLGTVLSERQRGDLQAALLSDTLAKAQMVGKTYLAFTPGNAADETKFYNPVEAFPQTGADLGERMADAVERVLARGHGSAILIGTDCPYLTTADLREAATCLQKADVCLGPALDGGYYLIGLRRPHGGVFTGVPWSSPQTLAATIARLSALSLTFRQIRPLADVDTPADLAILVHSAVGHGPLAACSPRVCELLRSWYPTVGPAVP